MTRTERKEFLRKLAGRMPRIFGGAGCQCQQCKATARYMSRPFSEWPKGAQATPGEARKLYAQHHSFAWKDARKLASIGAAGAGFYGTPAGMTRAEVAAVLADSFREVAP
jgi:hypothetical protein